MDKNTMTGVIIILVIIVIIFVGIWALSGNATGASIANPNLQSFVGGGC